MGCADAGHVPPYLRDRYRRDGEYRSRVDFACERGIPLSVFLGRVVEAGEPAWLPEDRDVVAVWQAEQHGKCPQCGTWRWEWDENPYAWFVDHDTCMGCLQVDGYRRQLSHEHTQLDGIRIGLYRTPREED